MRMILKNCDANKIKSQIIQQSEYEIILKLEDEYDNWKWICGYHKLVRVSPFGHGDKIHTSICHVLISKEEKKKEIKISEKDLRMDFFKSTGPGGQHKNKTLSAVRLTHIPTNTVVISSSERSQNDNKRKAMEQLLSRLKERENHAHSLNKDLNRKEKMLQKEIILNFYFNHHFVTNETSGNKTTQLKDVLNGKLELIM